MLLSVEKSEPAVDFTKNQNSENNTSYSKAVKTGSAKETNVARKSEKRKVYILGDSMIKWIQHW